jgi:hypothetical protein
VSAERADVTLRTFGAREPVASGIGYGRPEKTDWGINAEAQDAPGGSRHFVASVGDATFGSAIQSSREENDMANRPRFVAVCFLSAFWMSGLTGGRAADPGFCRPFAKAAIGQVREALADPRCGVGLQGARWSTDFAVHYEWCLGASLDAAGAERTARTHFFRACASR